MKIHLSRSREKGSVILTMLILTFAILFALMAYMHMMKVQFRSTINSETWNASLAVVEGGIEEALTHINWNCNPNSITSSGLDEPWKDGWTVVETGGTYTNYAKTNPLS